MNVRPYIILALAFLMALGVAQGQGFGNLRIERVVPAAANTDTPDEDGDFPAYIVLRASETSIATGTFLTDSPNEPVKWRIQEAVVLAGGDSVVIFASGKNRPTGKVLHTNFVYDCTVPYAGLFADREPIDTFSDRRDYCLCDGLDLITERSKIQYLIPRAKLNPEWISPQFTPGPNEPWRGGTLGVGYEVLEDNPYCDDLVLYAPMDRVTISGTTVKDVSGPTVHDGTIRDGDSLPIVPAQVKEGLRFLCDQTPFVDFGSHAELDPGKEKEFSVGIWLRAMSPQPTTQVIVSKGGFQSSGWSIFKTTGGSVAAVIPRTEIRLVSQSGQSYRTSVPNLALREWHHVAFVVRSAPGARGRFLQGYFDGSAVGQPVLIPEGEDFFTDSPLILGRDIEAEFEYCGEADDFAIWGRSLSDEELKQLFALGQEGVSFKDASVGGGGGGPGLYDPLIATDVEQEMHGINATALVRVPFSLSQFPANASRMLLRMRYDDGFQAYLNGVPVAARRAPSALLWNSQATSDRFDPMALTRETIDLSSHIGALRQGVNVLAIHALNASPNADRFVVFPELCLESREGPDPGEDGCVKSSRGYEFWLAFPENFEEEPGYPPQPSLCITGAPGTKGTVSIPGLNLRGFPRDFAIPPGNDLIQCVVIHLPKQVELEGADDIEDKAVLVKADQPINVYGQNRIDYSTDSYLGLPVSVLGTRYRVLTYKNVQSKAPLIQGTQLAIVAPFDDTKVTIIPKESIGSHPAGVPFTITLNSGQTYQLRNTADSPADVSGTAIDADKPVAVYGSHRCANIQSATQYFCDFLVEQLIPLEVWGRRYLVAPLETRAGDTLRIMAAVDKTQVAINENGSVSALVLDAGEVHEMTLKEPTQVTSELPVLVAQFSNSWDFDQVPGNLADPFMVLIQPANQWHMEYTISTPPKEEIEKSYVTIIAPNSAVYASVRISGNGFAPIGLGAPTGNFPNGEIFRRIELPASAGDCYRIFATRGPFALTVYGFDVFDSYGYPGGLCIPDVQGPVISVPRDIAAVAVGQTSIPNVASLAHVSDDSSAPGEVTVVQTPAAGTQVGVGFHPITLRAIDALGNETVTEVTFRVERPNTAPVSRELTPRAVPVNASRATIDLAAGFDDAEEGAETLRYSVVSVEGDREILRSWGIDRASHALVVESYPNLLGTVFFTVRATDANGLSTLNVQELAITGTPYQEWLNKTFTVKALRDPEKQVETWGEQADVDGDGNLTLGEAYHGGDPEVNDGSPFETVAFNAATGEWVFAWREAVPSNGVDGAFEWSEDLLNWQGLETPLPGGAAIALSAGEVEGLRRLLQARVPASSDRRLFFRLRYSRRLMP